MELTEVFVELQVKRNEVHDLNTKLEMAIRKNVEQENKITKLESDVSKLKEQLKVSMASIDYQTEAKRAITLAPNNTRIAIMELELEDWHEKYKSVSEQLTEVTKSRDELKQMNDEILATNKKLEFEHSNIMELIEKFKTIQQKLSEEQKFVMKMVENSNKIIEKLNAQIIEYQTKVETLEMSNKELLNEKIQFWSNNLNKDAKEAKESSHEKTDDDDDKLKQLTTIIEHLKKDLEIERKEKTELQEALLKSSRLQEKILSDFVADMETE